MSENLITRDEVAALLGLSKGSLYAGTIQKLGLMPAEVKRIGNVPLYRMSDVLATKARLAAARDRIKEPVVGGQRVYTVAQAAKMCGLSRARIYQLIKQGDIEPMHQGGVGNGRMVLHQWQVAELSGGPLTQTERRSWRSWRSWLSGGPLTQTERRS